MVGSFNRVAREEAVLDDAGSERAGKALEVARNVKFILVSNTLVNDVLILLVECGNCNSLVFEGVVGFFNLIDKEQRENRQTVAESYLFGEFGFLAGTYSSSFLRIGWNGEAYSFLSMVMVIGIWDSS